jgi:hypothetical protein
MDRRLGLIAKQVACHAEKLVGLRVPVYSYGTAYLSQFRHLYRAM